MPEIDVGIDSQLEPEGAWRLASDLERFSEWMTIFGGWKGEVPESIREGTTVASLIKVKGFRNVIHWTVTEYDEPSVIALSGHGRGAVRVALSMTVTPINDGSHFDLSADIGGGVLNGPIGRLVARVLHSDVHTSIENLAALR
ncbi:SRPBCC family protein [Gordonia sp. VNQ95]|jgi:hypothetical protein|uniref:type II toxin-antitoxin system Rv0910 family toxin n=1 Tax=Gordonia sp. VNQ95 TaxID=3156619 RepID=UPI0032B4CD99